jgi:hypothetical protein
LRVGDVGIDGVSALDGGESFIPTASPPASSAGLTIFEPLERRFKLFCNMELLAFRLFLAMVAAEFVLIVTAMIDRP